MYIGTGWDFVGAFSHDWYMLSLENRIEDVPMQPLLRLYPNPCNALLNVRREGTGNAVARRATVVDVLGRAVAASRSLDGGAIDVSQLAAGNYFVRLGGSAQRAVVVPFTKE
jgi:hypothetical protein